MSGQTLSERLANLSNSKSYVFLGRGGSGSNSNSNNNITDISKKATARASRSSYTANLSRDDFLIFELQSLPRQDKNDNNNTLINDSSDYSIVYHHWTLRQLYRHVVSSIRIRSTDPVPHSLKSSTVATPNATTTSGASTHDNDSVHTDVPRNKSSSTHNRTASTQRRQHSTPAVSRNNHRRQTSHDSHPSHHSHQYHHGSQPHAPIPPPKLLGSNLHPRDMRRLVTPFSASNEPELIVRRHVMVFNCDPLRAIITRDRLLVLVPMGADSVLKKLEERIVGNRFEYDDYDEEPEETRDLEALESKSESAEKTTTEDSGIVFESDLDSNDENDVESGFCEDNSAKKNEVYDENAIDHDDIPTVASDDWSDMIRMEMDQQKDLTFELLCVNACLSTVFEMLADDTAELQEKGLKYVQNRIIGNRNGSNGKLLRPEDSLAVIRNLKNAVQVMQARVKGFVQSIDRILNEDEDMALMNVSRLVTNPENFVQPVSSEMLEIESDEPELVLESNLNNALTLSNALDLIQGQVESASDLIDARMDAARNKFLLASLLMSIASLSLTVLTCVSGIFGMNLSSGLEETPNLFLPVTYGGIIGSLLLGVAIFAGMIVTGVITGLGPVDQDGIDSLF